LISFLLEQVRDGRWTHDRVRMVATAGDIRPEAVATQNISQRAALLAGWPGRPGPLPPAEPRRFRVGIVLPVRRPIKDWRVAMDRNLSRRHRIAAV
jgi:hypothetical protein